MRYYYYSYNVIEIACEDWTERRNHSQIIIIIEASFKSWQTKGLVIQETLTCQSSLKSNASQIIHVF